MASSWNIGWYRKSGIEDFDSKQGCPDFFEYLTILSRICGPPIPHELDYYRNEFHKMVPRYCKEISNPKSLDRFIVYFRP